MAEATKARTSVCKKTYINKDGESSSHASGEAVAIRFSFTNGAKHDVTLEAFPESIQRATFWHGLSAVLGDKFSAAGGDADVAETSFLAKKEQMEAGNWLRAGDAGLPRISIVLEAIIAANLANGDTMDEARIAKAKEALGDPAVLKGAKADPIIALEIKKIELARMKVRTEAAAVKAKEARKDKENVSAAAGF